MGPLATIVAAGNVFTVMTVPKLNPLLMHPLPPVTNTVYVPLVLAV